MYNTPIQYSLIPQHNHLLNSLKASNSPFNKMTSSSQLTIFLTFLLLSLASTMAEEPTKKEDKKIDVIVEGIVYCQSCDRFGTWSLTGADPIPSAKVSVICKDHKNRVSFYKAFDTDAHGYFHAQLEGFKMRDYLLDHPLQSCHVKLVSSPLKNCNLLSNVNYGLNGSPLHYENKRVTGESYEAVIYAAGPLAFRPAQCPH